jgi:hypothetical protein
MSDENARAISDAEWSTKIARLVVDTLVNAKVISDSDYDRAVEIAEEEIFVRLAIGDRPQFEVSAG